MIKRHDTTKEEVLYDMSTTETATVAQWVSALRPQAEGWVFESQSRQT